MWNFLIERARFTFILIMAVVLVGGVSLMTLPREASPEIKVPYASVVTIYPGASPLDIEDLITNPIEEAVIGIEDLKNLDSSSSEGFSSIFVEFETDADIKDRVRALQDAVSAVESQLPDGAQDPMVAELNFSNQPILTISLSSTQPHSQLVEMAERLESRIKEVNGISSVSLSGVREKEIKVTLDPAKLTHFGVSIMSVLQSIQGAESNLPLGSVETSGSQYSLRFSSPLDLELIENLTVRQIGDASIYLRDLGDISYELADQNQYARTSLQGSTPEDSISINVYKRAGGDVIKIVDEIKMSIAELQETELRNATVVTTLDGAQDIQDQLRDLSFSGLQTILLVAIILFLSLGFREALVAGLSIPFTFLITFVGLSITGASLNFLSLFSLILALGILVDTGIVITEGMHTRLGKGLTPKEVAKETIREYQWPLISGTMTTIAAFLPMLFMSGIIGEFVKHIPRTVIITLLASLFVGLGMLPVIGSILLKNAENKKLSWFEKQINRFRGSYGELLHYIAMKKRRQSLLLLGMFGLFVLSMALPATGVLKTTMFPDEDYYLFFIEVELPKGSLLEDTNEVAMLIEQRLLKEPDIESIVTTVGSSANTGDGVGATGVSSGYLANFSVTLKDDRMRESLEIVPELQAEFDKIGNAKVEVVGVSGGPPSAAAIAFRIFGEDLDVLKEYSDQAVATLEAIEGTTNISSSLDDVSYEFVLNLDHQRVQSAGLSPVNLAQVARISIAGMTASTISIDGKDTDIHLKTSANTSIDEILALPILTPSGSNFPLSFFAELSFEPAPNVIAHSEGERSVNIQSDLDPGYLANVVLPEFQEQFQPDYPTGYRTVFGGEAEEMAESFASLGKAMFFGMLLILVILVIQFNSFKQSFIILGTVPLALIGVFSGLTLVQLPLSFPAFIGVVALAGIVVNNAIILVDRINKNIAEGMQKEDAVVNAGTSRFQPIILTSITTVAGILPLALSDPSWGPLGFSIIFGLLFATILTLVVIPAAYMLFIRE